MENSIHPEIAYLLGALRDATADIRKAKNYEIKISQKEMDWLVLLQKFFETHFGIRGNITKHVNGAVILRLNGKDVVNSVLEISEMKIPQEFWETPKIIKIQPLEIQISYLRGFFDAEGGLPKNPGNAEQLYLSFSQKNKEAVRFLRKLLIKKGYKPTNITFCGKVWEFRLARKKDMIFFCDKIGSWHKDKKRRLEMLRNRIVFPE
ncbi:MAG: LAGLIDADG family homing endonuclease [Candidatus Aenigmarchaeota archaeon]|nr:LAGLIDADG family homing endonuclease [Candidatus Aenigmarchaeota archaeon]